MIKQHLSKLVAGACLVAISSIAMGHGMRGYGPNANDDGPGMMGGYGPGMMDGYGPGMMDGYGPGMMDGYGPGMMGGYGSGMMGGYGSGMMGGYGSGMMGGYGSGMMGGYGSGMMGGYGWGAQGYNLSDQQRSRLRTIQQQLIKQQTPLMQQMVAHRGELQSLYMDPTTEPKAISDEYGQLFSLRQKMIQNMLEARKQAADVLGQGTSQHQGESQGQ